MFTLISETILRFEREIKAGLRLWRRVFPAFLALRCASPCWFLRLTLWVKFRGIT
jgi:hypothetical protein